MNTFAYMLFLASFFLFFGCTNNVGGITPLEQSSQTGLNQQSSSSQTLSSVMIESSVTHTLSSLSGSPFQSSSVVEGPAPKEVVFINTDGVIAIDLQNKPVQNTPPNDGFEGNRGTDGDVNSYWSSDMDHPSPWYQVDLEGEYRLIKVLLTARQDQPRPQYRTDIAIWVSNSIDFTDYVELGKREGDADANDVYPAAGTWEVPLTFLESYRYVRVQRINDAGHFNFAELEVFGEKTADILIAKAGVDQQFRDADTDGIHTVQLDGSQSTPGKYVLTTKNWSVDGIAVAEGDTLSFDFTVGNHIVVLIVEDDAGNSVSDTLLVDILKGYEFDPNAEFKAIKNWDMARKMGRGINMGNTLEARGGEGSWAPKAEEYYFDDYKDAGFTNVRIPIHWGIRIDDAGTIEADFLDRVEQVVDWSMARGLVTIINVHHEEWVINDYARSKPKLVRIWEQLGERFKGKSENLVFELFNEPRDPMTADDCTDMNFTLAEVVRKTNPERVIILGGGNWGQFRDLYNVDFPVDDYTMAQFHYYDPHEFTHEDMEEWWEHDKIKADIDKVIPWLRDERKVPGFVGEFGVGHGDKNKPKNWEAVLAYYEALTESLAEWEVPYSVWDDSGWYKVYDRRGRTFNEIEKNLKWTE